MRRPRLSWRRRRARRTLRLAHGDTATLVDHLEELRRRLAWTVAWFAAAFAIAYWQHEHLVQLLAAPLPDGAPRPVTLSVAEPFLASFKVSTYAALCAVVPIAAWHLWAYVAPIVDPHRQRAGAALVLTGTMLFATGIAFGYFVALPQSLAFLVGFDDHLYDVQLRAGELYRFNAIVLLACGAVFQLPVVLVGLVRFRVLTVARLRRNRRVGYAVVAVIAVAMPGVDPVLTAVTFVPLLAMYETTILIASRLERRWDARRQQRFIHEARLHAELRSPNSEAGSIAAWNSTEAA